MKINDLRSGDFIKTRCGVIYFVVDYKVYIEEENYYEFETGLIDLSSFALCMTKKEDYISERDDKLTLDFPFLRFVDKDYNEDLTHKEFKCYDIMKVSDLFETIWEREE